MPSPKPIHPGIVLKEDVMDELKLSANALALELHVPANRITGIVNGERAITLETALRLERYFGASADFWLNLQSRYDLEAASALRKRVKREVRPRKMA
jgi:addiction module HigA family antidote